ncbi:MAG: hypothetical protein NVSMB23_15690 [Myxococcales bacterium]
MSGPTAAFRPARSAAVLTLCLLGAAGVSALRAWAAGTVRVDEAPLPLALRVALFLAFGACAAGAAVAYLRAVAQAQDEHLPVLCAGAVAIHLAAALALPLTSNDLFSNLAYGRMIERGLNPYLIGPAALAPCDPFLAVLGKRWVATPFAYGPPLAALDALAARAGTVLGAALAFKAAFLAFSLAGIAALYRLCRSPWSGPDAAQKFVLFAFCPLVAWELTAQAHNDGAMVLALLLFVAAALRGRDFLALAFLVAAVFSKFAAAPVLGLFLVWQARRSVPRAAAMAALAVLAGAALFAPFWAGPDTLRGPLVAAGGSGYDRVTRSFIALADLGAELVSGQARAASYAALSWAGRLLLFWLAVRFARRARSLEDVLVGSVLWLGAYDVIATAWFHPWYATWLLPLAVGVQHAGLRGVVALYAALTLTQYGLPLEPLTTVAIDVAVLVSAWPVIRALGVQGSAGPAGGAARP